MKAYSIYLGWETEHISTGGFRTLDDAAEYLFTLSIFHPGYTWAIITVEGM